MLLAFSSPAKSDYQRSHLILSQYKITRVDSNMVRDSKAVIHPTATGF
ncbi:MAG: hypothetical protein V7K27_25795 [Nostoc sp.]